MWRRSEDDGWCCAFPLHRLHICNRCAVKKRRAAAALLLALLWGAGGSPMRARGAPDGRVLSPRRHDVRERYLNERFQVATTRSPGRGLCVVAERAFAPGDVILSSEPFESVLFPALQTSAAANVLRARTSSADAPRVSSPGSRARALPRPRAAAGFCRRSRMPCMLSGDAGSCAAEPRCAVDDVRPPLCLPPCAKAVGV